MLVREEMHEIMADKVHLVEWATPQHSSRCPHPRGITAKRTASNVTEWTVESCGVRTCETALGHGLETGMAGRVPGRLGLVEFRLWLVVRV